jgi:hypothetical protein
MRLPMRSCVSTAQPTEGPTRVLSVHRWRRYGHDRAYVELDGRQIGYHDLASDQIVCEDNTHADMIATATATLAEQARAARYSPKHLAPAEPAPASPVAKAETPPPLALLPDRDLALNDPAEAARAQAMALRDAAPFRAFVGRLVGAKTDERNWRIGADAEEDVARRLAKLGPEWRVLHSIPVGSKGSDIDHLVIGPAGVFTINTKHHPNANVWVGGNTFKVNGHNQDYVRNSRFEAQRAAKLLSDRALFDVGVHGLIAVMGATRGFNVKSQPKDVTVMTSSELGRYLDSLPVQLGPPSTERIYAVARHLATWQPSRVSWSDL